VFIIAQTAVRAVTQSHSELAPAVGRSAATLDAGFHRNIELRTKCLVQVNNNGQLLTGLFPKMFSISYSNKRFTVEPSFQHEPNRPRANRELVGIN